MKLKSEDIMILSKTLSFFENSLNQEFSSLVGYFSMKNEALKIYREKNMHEEKVSIKLKEKISNLFVSLIKDEESLPVFSEEDLSVLSKAINSKLNYLNSNIEKVKDTNIKMSLIIPIIEEFEKDKKELVNSFKNISEYFN